MGLHRRIWLKAQRLMGVSFEMSPDAVKESRSALKAVYLRRGAQRLNGVYQNHVIQLN